MAEPSPTIGIDASRAGAARATGTERYSRRILEAMLRQCRAWAYRLYRNDPQPLNLTLPGDAHATEVFIPFPRLWTHVRLSAELVRHPVDALFVPAHVVPLHHPPATVVTIHDLGYLHEPEAHTGWSRRYLDRSTRWSARAASRVIAISEATRADLIRHYGIDPAKIAVIHHGVDERFRPMSPVEARAIAADLRLPERYLLYLGTLQPRKNLVRLIGAFNHLASEEPDLTLLLAGKRGWLVEQVDAAIAASPNRDRIRWLGHVADDQLPALYAAATAYVLPSLYEGFGLPAVEAMASGVPVVVSDRGALPEVVGDAAIVVDPTSVDAIAAGIRRAINPASRERLAAAGLERAACFQWAAAGRRTVEVIADALAEHRR